MARIILFTILLTLIYSWEETAEFALRIFDRSRPRKIKRYLTDRTVATALLLIIIPLATLYSFEGLKSFGTKLALVAAELFVISVAAFGVEEMNKRKEYIGRYSGMEKIGAVGFALFGLISPTFRLVASHPRSDLKLISKYALCLSLVVFAVFLSQTYFHNSSSPLKAGWDGFSVLNLILIGQVAILLTTEFLKQHLRLNPLGLLTSMRIIAGISVVSILFLGLA